MSLKFKNRLALFNTLAAAASTFLVFLAVYAVVFFTAYRHLDDDLRKEKEDVWGSIRVAGGRISMSDSSERFEKEHERTEVNPTFLQITDVRGNIVFRSANLKNARLEIATPTAEPFFFDGNFNGERIRLGQFPISDALGKGAGQLSVGISQAEAALVLHNLRLVLLFAFPFLTLIFYLASSFAAGRGIAPIQALIRAASKMDDQSIAARLPLPPHRDEIHTLAATINDLLDRIEDSLRREKQITADISHELRTPLAGIRGTLEVLLRKRRDPAQYEQKIEQVLAETDRLNRLLEQLLQLARIESGKMQPDLHAIDLLSFVQAMLEKWGPVLAEKQMNAIVKIDPAAQVVADASWLEIIVGNLLSNALKYGKTGGEISISWDKTTNTLAFCDDGTGIAPEHLPYIFDRFYRADASREAKIPGTGLGLSIARKLAELQAIKLSAKAQAGQQTVFLMQFGAGL